jgi:hypothetical protein
MPRYLNEEMARLYPMSTIQELALDCYTLYLQRVDGRKSEAGDFWTRAEDCPQWVTDMVFECHLGRFPCSWTYRFVAELCGALCEVTDEQLRTNELHQEMDGQVDIYTHKLMAWAGAGFSHYVDEAINEFGKSETLDQDIMAGQYLWVQELTAIILSHLSAERDRIEEEAA